MIFKSFETQAGFSLLLKEREREREKRRSRMKMRPCTEMRSRKGVVNIFLRRVFGRSGDQFRRIGCLFCGRGGTQDEGVLEVEDVEVVVEEGGLEAGEPATVGDLEGDALGSGVDLELEGGVEGLAVLDALEAAAEGLDDEADEKVEEDVDGG